MLEKAFNWIKDEVAPHIHIGKDGKEYSDKTLYPVESMEYHPAPSVLKTTTLTSVVDFITKSVDDETDFPIDRIIIHVMGPDKVLLTSEVTETGKRWDRILAEAQVDTFPFGRFMDRESFNIHLQTMFLKDAGAEALLALIGSISDGTVTDGADDGTTQRVTVRKGIQRVGNADVPNPVTLTPFRTFPETNQPASPFVFRLQPSRIDGEMPQCALFEADGSQWRIQAMQAVATWLADNLPGDRIEDGNIVIIA